MYYFPFFILFLYPVCINAQASSSVTLKDIELKHYVNVDYQVDSIHFILKDSVFENYNNNRMQNDEKCKDVVELTSDCNVLNLPKFDTVLMISEHIAAITGKSYDRPLQFNHLVFVNIKKRKILKWLAVITSRNRNKFNFIYLENFNVILIPLTSNKSVNNTIYSIDMKKKIFEVLKTDDHVYHYSLGKDVVDMYSESKNKNKDIFILQLD